MPPKGKAKAKSGVKDVPRLLVPLPPPSPACIQLPDSMLERHGSERCLFLAFADPESKYKVQVRSWIPGEAPALGIGEEMSPEVAKEAGWIDAKEIERVQLPNRHHHEARLLSCEFVRLQYRLVLASGPQNVDGNYVANWQSAPSEPLASYVDPPVELVAELQCDNDWLPPSVELSWKSSNMEWLKMALGLDEIDGLEHFAAWPGLMPSKVQVRWRVVQKLNGSEQAAHEADRGEYFVSGAIDAITKDSTFSFNDDTWTLHYREVAVGNVVRFSVRVGTAFRWSPWSQESEDILLQIREPMPVLGLEAAIGSLVGGKSDDLEHEAENDLPKEIPCINCARLESREVEVAWPSFERTGTLSLVEYRVMLCTLARDVDKPLFDDNGVVVSSFITDNPNAVSTVIRGVFPNTWYVVRVDARYPHIGKRKFSNRKAISAPFQTPFPERPPLQPLPVDIDLGDCELINLPPSSPDAAEADPEGSEGLEEEPLVPATLDWRTNPWVALRVEKASLENFRVEYNAAPSTQSGEQYYRGWQEPLDMQPLDITQPSTISDRNADAPSEALDDPWQLVRVGFPDDVPEVVVCRLVPKVPQIGVHAEPPTAPLVPYIAPVSFSARPPWIRGTDEGMRITIRFFLHPGRTSMAEHTTQVTPQSMQKCLAPKKGHRFVSRYQVRLRASSSTASAAQKSDMMDWATLVPAVLPVPCVSHAISSDVPQVDDGIVIDGTGHSEPLLEELRELMGWCGTRHEIDIDLTFDAVRKVLSTGSAPEFALRVGNDYRWSEWASASSVSSTTENSSGIVASAFAVPSIEPDPEMFLDCSPCSATRLRLRWAPFDRPVGIECLEYVVRASPAFAEQETQGCHEGHETIERIFLVKHPRRMTDDELLQFGDFRGQLPLTKILTSLQAARKRERDYDHDSNNLVKVELSGLLPCTRYNVSVSARLPAAAATMLMPASPNAGLSVEAETLGGEAAPAAPVCLTDFECSVVPQARAVILRIDSQLGYVLEYRAAGDNSAHFHAQHPAARTEFGGSWQTQVSAETSWYRVKSASRCDGGSQGSGGKSGSGLVVVCADLPGFGTDVPLPDAVEFRLCIEARSTAHPCRWTGAISEPVAVCFAPPRLPPRVKRILSDEDWCLSLTIELFKSASAPSPIKLLGLSILDFDDSGEELADPELADLRSKGISPTASEETWATQLQFACIPVGYGHRMVARVQFRYILQGGMSAALQQQFEDDSVDRQWQVAPAVPISSACSVNGAQCTLNIRSNAGLLDDGIYMFQVRVGDGCRWSTWSHTSEPYAFRVPPPALPFMTFMAKQQPVTVESVSSTVARVRWCDWRPAQGLTLLDYEVRATPVRVQDGSVVTTQFEHRYRGGFLEHEVPNLLPFTSYVFSVQARYPHVGSRFWGVRQESEPMALECMSASQDPPAPIAVPDEERDSLEDDSSGDGVSMQCFSTLEFPEEEDGMQYELEYAFMLGDDSEEIELRTGRALWLRPAEVKLLEIPSLKGVRHLPRWRVQLHDVQSVAAPDPLKLALFQRVCFRLRAQQVPRAPTMRFWSGLSPPVCTGFAGPDSVMAVLAASADRLVLELHFSLDRRLVDAAATAGSEEMRALRSDITKSIATQQDSSVASGGFGQHACTSGMPSWPRGFGHAYVTRYQLRVRMQVNSNGVSECTGTDWGAWEVFLDSSLPKEADRDMLLGGRFVGSAGGSFRGESPQSRWFCAEVPQGKQNVLQSGVAQVAVRIGDGSKWSPWRNTKDVLMVVQPPRPAREGDEAKAEWTGDVCTISWPPAVSPSGLDSIEYQLVVEPDSLQAPTRIGAVVIAPAANARRDDGGQRAEQPAHLLRPGSSQKKRLSVSIGLTNSTAGRGVGGSGLLRMQVPLQGDHSSFSAPTSNLRTSVMAGCAQEEREEVRVERQIIVVELYDLCPEFRYGFAVLARYPTVGPRTFTKVFETSKVVRRLPPLALASRSSESMSVPPPPIPEQLPVPLDPQHLRRWLSDDDARLTILRWDGVGVPSEDDAVASARFELQVSKVSDSSRDRWMTCGRSATNQNARDAWQPCTTLTATELQDRSCVLVRDLPFFVQQFRLLDTHSLRAGQPSLPVVAMYEQIPSVPAVKMEALGRKVTKSMGARITFPVKTSANTLRWATRYQARFQKVGVADVVNQWEDLELAVLDPIESDRASVLIREEDGLELGSTYTFQVRLGDPCRIGPWSQSSRPLFFAVTPPEPHRTAGIKIDADDVQVDLSWPPFTLIPSLVGSMPGFAEMPIEYTVVVRGGAHDEIVSTIVTRSTSIVVRPLTPATSYSASVAARWARFGDASHTHDGQLQAVFLTAPSSKRLVAELSKGFSNAEAGGAGPEASPVLGRSVLPQLVPMPPPRFTARDPLTYGRIATQEPPASARTSSYPRRPRPPVAPQQ
mmetsp:Transcript_110826/g.353142  ORF Transcript_110826/g.353142 Transcript_110826/m.353142 type:complete len:2409 (-) Transcript_110826:234-7460(-)